jgi:hypothetical protein
MPVVAREMKLVREENLAAAGAAAAICLDLSRLTSRATPPVGQASGLSSRANAYRGQTDRAGPGLSYGAGKDFSMGTSISTNVNSLNAQESFRQNGDFQAGVIQRLTSGYRISRPATTRPAWRLPTGSAPTARS